MSRLMIPIFALLSFMVMVSCSKDDPVIPNENELITTVRYVLTPANGSSPFIFVFRDLDGAGGEPPEIIAPTLPAGTVYTGTLQLLDESVSPSIDISDEVAEEGTVHQLFYQLSQTTGVTIQYDDTDALGQPVGLKTEMETGAATEGTLTIILRHEPDKDAAGVASGDITNAGGETDIEVTFDLNVE